LADLLDKFHTAPEIVQTPIILIGGAILLSRVMCLTELLLQAMRTFRPGALIDGVYRTSADHLVEVRDHAAAMLPDATGDDEAETEPLMRRLERSS